MALAGPQLTQGAETSHLLHTMAGAAIVVAGLYFARDVLVPVALALLLTFLLAPAVIGSAIGASPGSPPSSPWLSSHSASLA